MYKSHALILALLTTSASVWADSMDCDKASVLDAHARGLGAPADRLAAYREIVALCTNFNYLYKLGRALQETGDTAAAKTAYEKARTLVGDTRAEGLLYGRLAEVTLTLNQPVEAVAFADVAVSLTQPNTPDWIKAARRQADLRLAETPVSAESVTRGLSASRSFAVRPRIHVYILFDSFKDSLTKEGSAQVAELGKALAALPDNESIQIIGHTDAGAAEFFTRRLSEMRAERVVDEVLSAYPKLAGRLTSVGRGDKELRYTGNSDEEKRLNRRVEVVLGKP